MATRFCSATPAFRHFATVSLEPAECCRYSSPLVLKPWHYRALSEIEKSVIEKVDPGVKRFSGQISNNRLVWERVALGLVLSLLPGCACWQARTNADKLSSARRISLQGIEAESHGDWDQAEKLYAAAVETCPVDDRSRSRYAEALWRRGDRVGAIANMKEAVRLSNQSPEQIVQLGRMHFEESNVLAAEEQATIAIQRNQGLAAAWALKGDVAWREGRIEDALADYHRARTLPDCPATVPLTIADIYAQLGRPQRALATLQSLADQYPPANVPPEILYRQGLAYRQLERHEQAVACFTQVCQNPQAGPDQFFQLAESRLAAGDNANARLALQTALAKNPDHAPSRDLITRLGSLSGELSGVHR